MVIYTHTKCGVLRRSPFVIMYLQCDCVLQACLETTANSLRRVNFQQTQTSRKTFTNVNYSTKFQSVEGSELVRSLLLMRRDGETTESKADLLLLGSFNKTWQLGNKKLLTMWTIAIREYHQNVAIFCSKL